MLLRMTILVGSSLPVPALEKKRGVGAAEAERIRKRVLNFRFARMVRNVIEVARRVGRFLIDRGRKNLIAQGENTDACLSPAGRRREGGLVMDFVELIGTFLARSPKTRLSAMVSMASPMGVEVP